ncbi:mycofactocin biosynthesis chaperone MftB [Allobranchiibius sp. GilTou73]|uniref:mycofactocin biosynthesis chaperone MftB n=1 Tax=Allobranchiibius sp. GilTou73 TaxID=2904523 RepID=UPI001EEB7D47|nr:mycofactocin biosynthesis chaperone MftB [Allobranchiibius sp. GilTou73]UIJ35855.1 mycofactocin biosynthesis chaperone MftB [Allobranchiibius sp. GilTou73]
MLHEHWELSGSVALRPEPFGALAYDFDSRRLTFLKSPGLVRVVRALGDGGDVEAALVAADVPQEQWPRYLEALTRLAEHRMLRPAEVAA